MRGRRARGGVAACGGSRHAGALLHGVGAVAQPRALAWMLLGLWSVLHDVLHAGRAQSLCCLAAVHDERKDALSSDAMGLWSCRGRADAMDAQEGRVLRI